MENKVDTTLLSELENSIGSLYEAYGVLFPAQESFWNGLAKDEKEHAIWLGILGNYVQQGKATLSEKRFNVFAARSFLNYLKNELDKAAKKEITIINAAAIALYIEESIMEHNYYEVISVDSPELKDIFNNLNKATTVHIQRVKSFLNQVKTT
jgi:hypothetical protein